jgi:hypothetical protein
MSEVSLSDSDRTIFSICPNCNKKGKGVPVGNIYSMAYTRRQWQRNPKCENCNTDMQFIYEVKVDGN